MKAAICTRYGNPDVVEIREIAQPQPKPGEVLIRIAATTVSSGDARIRAARFPAGFALPARLALGLRRPRRQVLGTELAGVIEAVGSQVTRFRPGDEVFAFPGSGMGCHAAYRTMSADGAIARKPSNFSFEEAAAISFGGATALYYLRDAACVQRGERVLVNGASGAVGLAAVQLASHFGAHVTGVCSTANSAVVRGAGAEEVINYETADFAASDVRYDVIVDTVGNAPLRRCRPVLADKGRLLLLASGLAELLKAPLQSLTSGVKVVGGPARERPELIIALAELCEAGAFKPVIDRVFPFEDIADAHARVDTGRKVGSVVVTV